MVKIYTRKGDRGQTSVLGGGRLSKADPRIRALGSLDELNAALGVALADSSFPDGVRPTLCRVQSMLFEVGAALASVDPAASAGLFEEETRWLEEEIDRVGQLLPELNRFILPGGSPNGARMHWIRAVSRRAETLAVEAAGAEEGRMPMLTWLNRLSDAFFVIARLVNRLEGRDETPWESPVRPPAGKDPESRGEGPMKKEKDPGS